MPTHDLFPSYASQSIEGWMFSIHFRTACSRLAAEHRLHLTGPNDLKLVVAPLTRFRMGRGPHHGVDGTRIRQIRMRAREGANGNRGSGEINFTITLSDKWTDPVTGHFKPPDATLGVGPLVFTVPWAFAELLYEYFDPFAKEEKL